MRAVIDYVVIRPLNRRVSLTIREKNRALCKRNNIWWIRLFHNEKRIQRSTGTLNKLAAQELHDQFKADLWCQCKLGEKLEYIWQEAVVKWLKQASYKRSLNHDKFNRKWLNYLKDKKLKEIDNQMIEKLACIRESEGVTSVTVNRLLVLVYFS